MRQRPPFANALFFPAAAFYGAVVIPVWVMGVTGVIAAPAGLMSVAGHAHEMLFGFAMAVVAGYLLGPQPMRVTLTLLICWLLARVGFLLAPGTWLAAVPGALFAGGLAWKVVPRFSMAAKKWRNKMIAPLVGALALATAAAAWLTGRPDTALPTQMLVLSETVLLLAMLLFFMGGRIIAPAIAGHILRQGRPMEARVQPALEGAVLICFITVLVLNLIPAAAPELASGVLLLVCGGLTLTRLVRWQLWHCSDRPDLLVLATGYLWLGLGLLLEGLSRMTEVIPGTASVHTIAVGALGTLTVGVMARTRLLYRFRDANMAPTAHVAAAMMSIVALARLLAAFTADPDQYTALLTGAAVLWSASLLLLVPVLLRTTTLSRSEQRGLWQID